MPAQARGLFKAKWSSNPSSLLTMHFLQTLTAFALTGSPSDAEETGKACSSALIVAFLVGLAQV